MDGRDVHILHRVLGKIVFVSNPLQPIPRLHIAERDFKVHNAYCDCRVTPIVWPFSDRPIAA